MNVYVPRPHLPKTPPVESEVASYYARLTDAIETFGGDYRALHFGLWGPATTNDREAFERANETLVRGCDLGPKRRVLDSGCGAGETAIRLADRYGVRVTGLTNCKPHVAAAAERAAERGVGHLVDFQHGDFMDLPFPDESFDVVLNQESFCYAPDKLAYLKGVFRILKPGGRWRAVDPMRTGAPISGVGESLFDRVHRGFRLPPLAPWRDVVETLGEAGFHEVEARDLRSEVTPATKKLRNNWLLFALLVHPAGRGPREGQDLMDATVAYHEGLEEGLFTYCFLSATRPEGDVVNGASAA